MADTTHEPSYYEIALTNRQVVVAFVILLSCVLAAFLSGVWIGRESTARAAQEQMVRNSSPQQQAAKEGRNLDELEFFDARKKKGEERTAQQEAVAAPPANSTLFDDLNRRKKNDEPAPEQATPPVPEPAPAQAAPAPAPSRVEPAADPDGLTKAERRKQRRERQKAAEAAAAQTTPPAPARVAGKTAEPAVPKGSYVIQVFSSADKAQADSIRARLAGGGQKAYLSPIDRGGRTMYRVRIGPFKSRGDAQTVADKVRKGYKLDTWVTE